MLSILVNINTFTSLEKQIQVHGQGQSHFKLTKLVIHSDTLGK